VKDNEASKGIGGTTREHLIVQPLCSVVVVVVRRLEGVVACTMRACMHVSLEAR
jgi:hypothetical protein